MAPILPTLFTPFLQKRDYECTYYDASCSTHRLVIMIIIIVVSILVSAILSLLYVRSRRSKASKAARSRMWNQHALASQTCDNSGQPRQQRARERNVKMHNDLMRDGLVWGTQKREGEGRQVRREGFGGMYGAPPPYTPRRPERAFGAGR